MSASSSAPGAQQRRFAAYLDSLAQAAEQWIEPPLKSYCTGLFLPGERKSVEPMAARLAPDNVRRIHQSLHHLVANAPWNDETLLASAPVCLSGDETKRIRDGLDGRCTGFPKKGTHSVGVARQYCGQIGKQAIARLP